MMELARTQDKITAGLVNVPLTKPAFLYFIASDKISKDKIVQVFLSSGIEFTEKELINHKIQLTSKYQVDRKLIIQIFNNYRSLRPKLITDWRYLFWEIDTKDNHTLDAVLSIYQYHKLPVYYHHSMRGYHFISIKPIDKELFKYCVKQLRPTNESYPPIALRIMPNKYEGEKEIYKVGYVNMPAIHNDTLEMQKLMYNQQLDKIAQKYFVVWYPFSEKDNKGEPN